MKIDLNNISFRPQTIADAEFLLQLTISIRQAELQQIGWPQPQIYSFLKQQFETQLLSYQQRYPAADYSVIQYLSQPIGRLYLDHGEDEDNLIEISLVQSYRGQKLGSSIIRHILESASARQKPVRLHVEASNPAIRLYKRLGFIVEEDHDLYQLMRWRSDFNV